ncbi:MAG: protein kinase, partial [Myxococcota bacterium]
MTGERKALRALIADGVSLERAQGIGTNLSLVVDTLHRRGRVHGGLHPGVVTVADDDTVALADGAEELDSTLAVLEELAAHRTESEIPLERLAYQSPEQLKGQEPSTASDIFSVGCMLYELTTGRPPFSGSTRESLIADVCLAQPVDVLEHAPSLPRAFARAIHKCLELRPADRLASLETLVTELDAIGRPPHKHRTTQKTEAVPSSLVQEPEAFDDVTDDSVPAELLPSERAPDYPVPARRAPRADPSVHRLRAAVVALAVIAVAGVGAAVYLGLKAPAEETSASTVDPNTLLVVPMEVRGDNGGADFLGRAFAEAIAVNLALDGTLKVLPVPTEAELTRAGSLERPGLARKT